MSCQAELKWWLHSEVGQLLIEFIQEQLVYWSLGNPLETIMQDSCQRQRDRVCLKLSLVGNLMLSIPGLPILGKNDSLIAHICAQFFLSGLPHNQLDRTDFVPGKFDLYLYHADQ